MKKNKFLAGLATVSLVIAGMSLTAAPAFAGNDDAPAGPPATVSWCHAKEVVGAKNGWNAHIDQSIQALNGHDNHPGDIFPIIEGFALSGQNLTTLYPAYGPGVSGADILAGGCQDSIPGVATATLAFVPATCEAPEQINLAASTTSHASFGSDTDPSALGYNIVATADLYYEFADGDLSDATLKTFSGTLAGPLSPNDPACADPQPALATASVSFTQANCFAGEKLILGTLENASWESGATNLEGPLSYDFDAIADENAEFAGGSTTKSFTGSLDGPLSPNDPACADPQPALATASVSFTQANCFAGEKLILGTLENASWESGATNLEGPLSYDFDAIADENAEFAGGSTTKSFTGSLDGPLDENDPACVLGLVMPKVTSTPITCSANGSYTLGVAEGYDPTHVTWTVNGTPGVASGTYPVTTSQIITVSAQAVAPNGLELDWVNPAPLGFIAPDAADCLQLTTLAYTGSSAGTDNDMGLLVAGGLVFLGALGMVTRRRIVGARAE